MTRNHFVHEVTLMLLKRYYEGGGFSATPPEHFMRGIVNAAQAVANDVAAIAPFDPEGSVTPFVTESTGVPIPLDQDSA